MKTHDTTSNTIKTPGQKATRPRFRIEKLEDRIAPAKGGIPGSPNSGYGWGYEHFCYSHPHHPKCAWLWG